MTNQESKATPGPWLIAREDKTFVYALGPNGTNIFSCLVQAAGPEKASKEEKEANARLIAAAPELLEALKYARRYLRLDDHDIAFVDAAIARAEGRTE